MAGVVRRGEDWHGMVRLDRAGEVGKGVARCVHVWLVWDWQAWCGARWLVLVGLIGRGVVWQAKNERSFENGLFMEL